MGTDLQDIGSGKRSKLLCPDDKCLKVVSYPECQGVCWDDAHHTRQKACVDCGAQEPVVIAAE